MPCPRMLIDVTWYIFNFKCVRDSATLIKMSISLKMSIWQDPKTELWEKSIFSEQIQHSGKNT